MIQRMRLGILLGLLVFIFQAFSLPFVGMTWDEPSSFFFGRANLRFWLTGDRGYVTDFKNKNRFPDESFQYIYGEDIYPPVSFVVASATSYVFAEKLHVMTPEVAHHLGLVAIGAIGIIGFYGICIMLSFSPMLAAGTTLLYATYPTIVGMMRNDAKDIPLMSMLVVFLFFFLRWLQAVREKKRRPQMVFGIATAISLGLMEGTKVSGAIIIPIIGIWLGVSILFPKFRRSIGPVWERLGEGVFLTNLAFITFLISWPWLWDDPIRKLSEAWAFFKVVGRGMPTLYLGTVYAAGGNLPWHYPIGILLTQTPILLLIVGAIGVVGAIGEIIRKRNSFPLLPLLWFFLAFGRFFLPGILIYAKVRHFIDAMPAFFLLVGYGVKTAGGIPAFAAPPAKPLAAHGKAPAGEGGLGGLGKKKIITVALFSILLLHNLWIMMTHFPYEPSYFNFLVGGTKAAAQKHLFDVEYWASGVKEAMRYIDRTETPASQQGGPTTVYACTMGHLAVFYETPKLTVKGVAQEAQYFLVPNSASWFGAPRAFNDEHHEKVYTISRAGGELFWVYKVRDPVFWNCGQETEMNYTL